jgi:hypothetical protein
MKPGRNVRYRGKRCKRFGGTRNYPGGGAQAHQNRSAPGHDAGLVAAIFTVLYLTFSVPALIARVATTRFGLHSTALVYSASLAAMAAGATCILVFRRTAAIRALATCRGADRGPGLAVRAAVGSGRGRAQPGYALRAGRARSGDAGCSHAGASGLCGRT